MTSPTLLRIINTLAYFFFLGSDIYSIAGPDAPDVPDAYGLHPTYLTPAPWAFAIWGVVHFLFFGFIVWQASNHLFLALIVLCFASASITLIYYGLSTRPPQTLTQSLFVHAPVSLYHGWLVFVIWLNILAIFIRFDGHNGDERQAHPSLLVNVIVGLILAQLTATAIAYTEYKGAVGDVPGAFTIAWALFAVFANQPAPFIKWASFACGIIVTIYAFFSLVRGRPLMTATAGERAPLLHAAGEVPGNGAPVISEEANV
ncbi:hypothetical protein HDV00_007368 [Rhizophlyctis rosea]|nr:hypothetical protein HDV00_007368 [Rhizophlyctis rosea]